MLEHVGPPRYPTLSRVIDRCLEPHGRGLVHSIGRARPQRMNAWIERNIFPGAYIPSLGEMMAVFEPRFAVLDVENLRRHYARTLEHWLDRFEKAGDRVREMFDERFVRTWRLYLASSIAAFRTGSTQLYQVLFSRAGNDRIPWTRAHAYREARAEGERGAL
jgi:cyclopropane-fatty-acyl-phospholipid synthase